MLGKTNFERVSHYLMESILLYILLMILYFHLNQLPPIGAYFAIILLGGLVFLLVLCKLKERASLFLFIVLIAAFSFIGTLLDMNVVLSFLLSSFAGWRVYINKIKEPNFSAEKIVVITFCGGGLIYIGAWLQQYLYLNVILLFMACQLFFLTLQKVVTGIQLSNGSVKQQLGKKQYWVVGLFFISLGLLSTSVMMAIFYLLKNFWPSISYVFVKTIYVVSLPLLNLLEKFFSNLEVKPMENKTTGAADHTLEELRKEAILKQYDIEWINIFMIIIVIVAIAAICIYFIKLKNKAKIKESVKESTVQFQTKKLEKSQYTSIFKKKINSPENKMRKLIFELQQVAKRANRGRFNYETIEEWLTRENFLNEQIVDIYSNVRYGEMNLQEHEYEKCVAIVDDLKRIIRDLQKE